MSYFLSFSGPVQALDDEQLDSLSSDSRHLSASAVEAVQGETTNLLLYSLL